MSLTFGILAVGGNSFYSALQERLNREATERPVRERVLGVSTVRVVPETITPVMTAFGEVQSRRTLDVRASAAGRIVDLSDDFEDGAQVFAGDLLAQIDPTDAEDDTRVARTELLEAEAELRDAERALVLARDEVQAAEAQTQLRSMALTRQRDLLGRGVGTDAAVEDAALAESAAQQAVLARRQAEAQAQSRLDLAGTRLERQKINLANMERRLADTEIRAAFDGAIADVQVDEGGLVAVNEQMATLIDPEALEVSFRLSTAQYARLLDDAGRLIRAPVTATLDVLGLDLVATGRITRVGAAVGEGQTGRLLFARLETFAGFRPGDFVTVRIEEPPLDQLARIPATAVDAAATVLAIGENERLEQVRVEVMRREADDVLIRAPDLADRLLVAERTPLVGEGIRVRPMGTPEGETAETAAAPAMISLTQERRARLIAFVEGNTRMPAQAKERVLTQLQEEEVPTLVVERIEARMGG
ncbi:efflux RND transporter periplasmic adaptor subunit [Actibacterium sp. 188UL27-1]|uniref:efflux RND transporter periplasmic adaptor subunit n=1 Tax=Actibacterium sp. 188UL27-1 TaxID=2786961 RepID=UPI00351CB0E9